MAFPSPADPITGLDEVNDIVARAGISDKRKRNEAIRKGLYNQAGFQEEFSPQIGEARQPSQWIGAGRKVASNQGFDDDMNYYLGQPMQQIDKEWYYYGADDPSKGDYKVDPAYKNEWTARNRSAYTDYQTYELDLLRQAGASQDIINAEMAANQQAMAAYNQDPYWAKRPGETYFSDPSAYKDDPALMEAVRKGYTTLNDFTTEHNLRPAWFQDEGNSEYTVTGTNYNALGRALSEIGPAHPWSKAIMDEGNKYEDPDHIPAGELQGLAPVAGQDGVYRKVIAYGNDGTDDEDQVHAYYRKNSDGTYELLTMDGYVYSAPDREDGFLGDLAPILSIASIFVPGIGGTILQGILALNSFDKGDILGGIFGLAGLDFGSGSIMSNIMGDTGIGSALSGISEVTGIPVQALTSGAMGAIGALGKGGSPLSAGLSGALSSIFGQQLGSVTDMPWLGDAMKSASRMGLNNLFAEDEPKRKKTSKPGFDYAGYNRNVMPVLKPQQTRSLYRSLYLNS